MMLAEQDQLKTARVEVHAKITLIRVFGGSQR